MNRIELFELICPVPDPWASLEQRERHEHLDLSRMSRPDLLRELGRVKLRLLLDDAPDAWLLKRHEKLCEASRHAC